MGGPKGHGVIPRKKWKRVGKWGTVPFAVCRANHATGGRKTGFAKRIRVMGKRKKKRGVIRKEEVAKQKNGDEIRGDFRLRKGPFGTDKLTCLGMRRRENRLGKSVGKTCAAKK